MLFNNLKSYLISLRCIKFFSSTPHFHYKGKMSALWNIRSQLASEDGLFLIYIDCNLVLLLQKTFLGSHRKLRLHSHLARRNWLLFLKCFSHNFWFECFLRCDVELWCLCCLCLSLHCLASFNVVCRLFAKFFWVFASAGRRRSMNLWMG